MRFRSFLSLYDPNEYCIRKKRQHSFHLLNVLVSQKELIELSWIEQHHNLILLGPIGVDKTFLAVCSGLEAVQRGYRVFFVTMDKLVNLLKSEEFLNKSKVQLKRLGESNLVIVDDLMYMAMD